MVRYQFAGVYGVQVFVNPEGALYGFKGLAGRLGPIGVHASMLAILGGVAWGSVSGYKGSVMVPQDSDFLTASALRPASPFAQLPAGIILPSLQPPTASPAVSL